MAIGYRAILRLDQDTDAIRIAETELDSWLRTKLRSASSHGTLETTAWSGDGLHVLGERSSLRVTSTDGDQDGSRRRKFTLEETGNGGTFEVNVYAIAHAASRGRSQTILIETGRKDTTREDAIFRVDPPRLVGRILGGVSAWDGVTPVLGEPDLIGRLEAEDVVSYITDPERLISVVVAVSPDDSLNDKWKRVISSLTRKSVGVSSSFVISTPAASALNDLLPDSHQVEVGRVRTFLPKVDLSDPQDGFRHKILGPATFLRYIDGQQVKGYLPSVHAQLARRRFVDAGLPQDLRRDIALLNAAESQSQIGERVIARVEQNTAAVEPIPEAPRKPRVDKKVAALAVRLIDKLRPVIKKWLGSDDLHPDHISDLDVFIAQTDAKAQVLQEELDRQTEARSQLEDDIEKLRRDLENQELELAIQTEAATTHSRLSYEREQMLKANHIYATAALTGADWSSPSSLEDLVDLITPGSRPPNDRHVAHERVKFSGDLEPLIDLGSNDQTGRLAMIAWECIHTLFDYARLKDEDQFDGSFHHYLTGDGGDGYRYRVGGYAAKESETVANNPAMRRQRTFAVPATVDPSGSCFMEQHFRLETQNQVAPRLYFFDATRIDGMVYIGYIGRHLDNTRTN